MILGASILSANPGLIFWTIVTFLILLALLSWKAWKPILKIIAEREKTIHDALDSARTEREEAEKMRAEQAAAMEKFRRENAEELRKAQADLERARNEKLKEIEKESAERRAQAAREIEETVAKARGELKAYVADLAIDATRRLIEHTMDEKKQRALVQEYLENLQSQASEKAA